MTGVLSTPGRPLSAVQIGAVVRLTVEACAAEVVGTLLLAIKPLLLLSFWNWFQEAKAVTLRENIMTTARSSASNFLFVFMLLNPFFLIFLQNLRPYLLAAGRLAAFCFLGGYHPSFCSCGIVDLKSEHPLRKCGEICSRLSPVTTTSAFPFSPGPHVPTRPRMSERNTKERKTD